jgi:exosome complex RNA-binding protein Csl4
MKKKEVKKGETMTQKEIVRCPNCSQPMIRSPQGERCPRCESWERCERCGVLIIPAGRVKVCTNCGEVTPSCA